MSVGCGKMKSRGLSLECALHAGFHFQAAVAACRILFRVYGRPRWKCELVKSVNPGNLMAVDDQFGGFPDGIYFGAVHWAACHCDGGRQFL